MTSLTPYNGGQPRPSRREQRLLAYRRLDTAMQVTDVQRRAIVQAEKVREIDNVTRAAAVGHANLSKWAAAMAGDDPFLTDDLKFFLDVGRLGKGEMIASLISDFGRSF